ncbi:MAG: DUF2271 domain-containing protein [Treponema sp.]|nr:DUF2271 domain-containing protein [Treponema sp.]
MKKRLYLTILTVILVLGTAIGFIISCASSGSSISPLRIAGEQEPAGQRFVVSFSYEKVRTIASSQYAIWIEDTNGNYVDTLYVTGYTARRGHRNRPNSLPQWVRIAQPASMPQVEIDTISGATPSPGDYKVSWDLTDRNGNRVTGTQYRFFMEATMNNGDNAVYSGIISLGEDTWNERPIPVYSIPDSSYRSMITNVQVAYYPR